MIIKPNVNMKSNKKLLIIYFFFFLERYLNMWIPGFGTDELRPYKKAPITEAHKQRTALIKKVASKKY